jgi:cytochrome c oxidase cbb3-type subunit III
MCSRFPISAIALLTMAMSACHRDAQSAPPAGQPDRLSTIESPLAPGLDHSPVSNDPRAAAYYDNPEAVNTGKRLFQQYNCSGCHSSGGGGMGPSLMDDDWIYGSRLEQIHATLVEGRPNGMPAWGGKVPDQQLWQLAAYVRSMSLPQTLAAQSDATPSQFPAPVPPEVDQDSGWSPPPATTNDYTTTTTGPK